MIPIFLYLSNVNFFDIDFLKPFEIKKGITFITSKGEVKIFKPALDLSPIEFIKDVRGRDLNNIDLVISDYEPITAWIAKLKNKTSMGIAHQYAFKYNIPIFGDNFQSFMKEFIPSGIWSNFSLSTYSADINRVEIWQNSLELISKNPFFLSSNSSLVLNLSLLYL